MVKYTELKQFDLEVTNVLLKKYYDIKNVEMVAIIDSWLRREGLQLIHKLTKTEQELHGSVAGPFTILNDKCR